MSGKLRIKTPCTFAFIGSYLFALVGSLLIAASGRTAVVSNVVAWGGNEYGQASIPPNLTGAVAIAAGGYHSLAVRANGTVAAWGLNNYGQLDVPADLTNVLSIAAGGYFSLALRSDGTVIGWGANELGQASVPGGLSNVVEIAAGWNHGLAVKADGTVTAWGQNNAGQAEPPSGANLILSVAGGEAHSLALRFDGSVIGWGDVSLPSLTNIVAIAANGYHDLALRSDGTIWESTGQVPEDFNNAIAVAAGYSHSLALRGDGTVVAWGVPGQWQPPTNLNGVTAIAAGYEHSLALQGVAMPVGMPRLFIDGGHVVSSNYFARADSVRISLFGGLGTRLLLYTLDGSDPSVAGIYYEHPFDLHQSAVLRVVGYNDDFTESIERTPVEIVLLPSLTATTAGGGTVAVDPPTGAYHADGTASLSAAPAPGWTFMQWVGDWGGTNPTVNIPMDHSRNVRAVFGTSLSNTVVGSGGVIRSQVSALYPYGTQVRLTAIPQPGSYFLLWGNAGSGTNNPLLLSITSAAPVAAVFASLSGSGTYALTVVADGSGEVSVSPRANRYSPGASVTLTALPEGGQQFLAWGGSTVGSNNPIVVTMNQSKVITATFTARPRFGPPRRVGQSPNQAMRLTLVGDLGLAFRVEGSADFAQWEPVADLTNTLGTTEFTEPFATNIHRYFRARKLP